MKSAVAVCVIAAGCSFDVSGGALSGDDDDDSAVPDASLRVPDGAAPAPDAATLVPMIEIPGGTFEMGCRSVGTVPCDADELPAHDVTLSSYWIDQTEVTRDQFAACVRDGACDAPHCELDLEFEFEHPVVCVTWQQAADYCAWADKRLPTEAEWEHAARGTDGRAFPWGNAPDADCTRANGDGCSHGTRPVGSYPAGVSPFDVHDMAGNAFEWISDYYDASYYSHSAHANDPTGPASWRPTRVARGGSFLWSAHHYRATNRSQDAPLDYFADLGFRCAR